jgi:hypothetical protein
VTLLVIRCTRELLKGVAAPASDEVKSTTDLGDWFAQQVVVGDQSYILLVSRLSRLPLVIHGDDVDSISSGFSDALERLLRGLNIAPEAVAREVSQCRTIVFAAGDGSSVRASGNDFAKRMKRYVPEFPPGDATDLSLRLGDVPLKTLGFALPSEVTHQLLD